MERKILKIKIKYQIILAFCFLGAQLLSANAVFASSTDGTIDSTYKYGWGENIGWINFNTGSSEIHISDSGLTGYALNENAGWIYLGDVVNDGEGNLSGYAWSENTGWINFNPTNGGVVINSSGVFTGSALSENAGWIIFSGDNAVKTDWRPQSARPECNNATDDDSDGLTDYPDDDDCASRDDTTEAESEGAGGGGGGPSPSSYNPPSEPSGGFDVYINDDSRTTASRVVTLTFIGSDNTSTIWVSENPDFIGETQYAYDASLGKMTVTFTLSKGEGIKTIYAKFCTQQGYCTSEILDQITYQRQPVVEIIQEVPEIIVEQIEEVQEIVAEVPGRIVERIREVQEVIAPIIEAPEEIVEQILAVPELVLAPFKENPTILVPLVTEIIIPRIPELALPDVAFEKLVLVPFTSLIGLGEIEEPQINFEQLVSIETPAALMGEWEMFKREPLAEFVLAPLPSNVTTLAQKFPSLGRTFEEVGVNTMGDISKLQYVTFKLPGLTESVGLSTVEVEPGKFAFYKSVPVAELTAAEKEKMPTEVVFARTGGETIDLNMALSMNEEGEQQKQIRTISNKPLQLVIKPERPVKSVKGYIVLREIGQTSLNSKTNNLFGRLTFAETAHAISSNGPVVVEQELVLLEFEYTDPDNDGIYTADIQAPVIEGEYEIITVMEFEDAELGKKAVRLITVIDPEGYVYEKTDNKETRIPGAIVTLFWMNPETSKYEVWPADQYNQENSQTTDVRGTYSFLVPEGYYYIKVEAPGYIAYDGKSFEVTEGEGVHMNIELTSKYWMLDVFDWKSIALCVVVIMLLYNFYRDKMREKSMKSK